MVDCNWASALTRYDCRPVRGLSGADGLEIGTPFSRPDGSAINLYMMPLNQSHVEISDNGDTLAHLSGMGIDVWHSSRLRGLRDAVVGHSLTLDPRGDFRMIAQLQHSAIAFARAITALLAVNGWASEQMKIAVAERDLVSEAEPYIIARNANDILVRNPKVRGASRAEHTFDFRHGNDLIDVIAPTAQSTGGVMRKVGDVANGPFADPYSPLIIVDDRFDPVRAEKEMGILASMVRTESFSRLVQSSH